MVLQNQGKERLEEDLSGKISAEQENVQNLKNEASNPYHTTSAVFLPKK